MSVAGKPAVGRVAALLLLPLVLLAGCTTPRAYLGEATERVVPEAGYRGTAVLADRTEDDLLVLVSLSGGGMRASAMAYGLFEQLAADQLEHAGRRLRVLDEVDVLSAVSGGAVTATYYALYGDRLFADFAARFLDRDVTAALRRRVFLDPRNWLRLASSDFSRGDLYAEYFDRRLFRGSTFADLERTGGRPFLVINATDIGLASRFEFTQDDFDLICMDLARYPLSRAVAASSSVPVISTPITLRNHAGQCGYRLPTWVEETLRIDDHSSRRYFRAAAMKARTDTQRFAYLHLVDGALSDNLGARALLDALNDADDRMGLQRLPTAGENPRIVYISLNAGDSQVPRIGMSRGPPDMFEMLRLMGTVPVDRYTAESRVLLREALQEHARRRGATLHYIEIELESLRADAALADLVELPTSFDLPRAQAGALRCATRRLLAAAEDYRGLLAAYGSAPVAPARCER
jgi:NTE family protein